MNLRPPLLALLFSSLVLVGCHAHAPSSDARGRIEMTQLTPSVWMHTSVANIPQIGPFPTNGLVIAHKGGPLIIDTGWNEAQTLNLIDWAEVFFEARPQALIVTHAHNDRLGGIEAAKRRGVPVYALPQTAEFAKRDGWPVPDRLIDASPVAPWPDSASEVEVFFPGHAHAPDNVVVWVPGAKVLFGGCAVKNADARDLGYTRDADLAGWSAALSAIQARYPSAKHVIPGHGSAGGPELLKHTQALLKATTTRP